MLLLNIACLFIILRTVLDVKRRTYQWTEHQVQRMHTETNGLICKIKDLKKNIKVLRQQLKRDKITVASKLENKELKESCKAHTEQSVRMEEENYELQANFEVDKRMLEANVEILEKKLKMTNMLLPEKDWTLKQKLAQQQLHFRERETKLQMEIETFEIRIMEMTTERQKNEDCYKTQITELEECFSDLENSLSSSKYENEMLKEYLKACSRKSADSAEEIKRG
ncbi:hypothetical protein SKAU_G00047120 [Synaphobranchus kaupii]|uniref:Coiled-coil domain-containing protein 172 n=1 Tax=Synaphobranchus kaupii TaxID=118154 RepID=A0A9Q1J9E3_SYNKA|nr:hypothetical protein SKAU_G00047120 [Synaphobranchus kaupii]